MTPTINQVFLVVWENCEYSDQAWGVVGAFKSRDEADRVCAEMQPLAEQAARVEAARFDRDSGLSVYERRARYTRAVRVVDNDPILSRINWDPGSERGALHDLDKLCFDVIELALTDSATLFPNGVPVLDSEVPR